jgi:hypothetical protein
MTDKRLTAFCARAKDRTWLDQYPAALARFARSSFLQGHGSKGWRPDVDWFLKPDSVTVILEGKYDDGPKRPAGADETLGPPRRPSAAELAELIPGWTPDPAANGSPAKGGAPC